MEILCSVHAAFYTQLNKTHTGKKIIMVSKFNVDKNVRIFFSEYLLSVPFNFIEIHDTEPSYLFPPPIRENVNGVCHYIDFNAMTTGSSCD